MKLIDTHAHLYVAEFESDLKEVIKRAKSAALSNICLPSIDSQTFESLKKLTESDPGFFIPMIGLHPCSVKLETYKDEMILIKSELQTSRYKAVGEIGMDLYWDTSTKDLQAEVFIEQCKLAADYNLPIAIHSRNATRELIDILQVLNLPNLQGVFHCFGDGVDEANDIINLGFYLGIGGVLTFKNSGLSEVLTQIDLKHMVLETDSPYLAPVPFRGKRNESSYLRLIADKLAEVKGVSVEEIAEITTFNAQQLFGID